MISYDNRYNISAAAAHFVIVEREFPAGFTESGTLFLLKSPTLR